jgi:malonyl CoA-acyl carrier protein transacylase
MASINLTYAQVQKLAEAFGGDEETVVCIANGNGHSGAGIYVSCAEYPEEGSDFLGPEN